VRATEAGVHKRTPRDSNKTFIEISLQRERQIYVVPSARTAEHSLGGGLLEEGDEVGAVLGLLEPGVHHLGAGDVLLGVEQVLEQGLLAPGHGAVLVGVRVGEAGGGARGAAEETAQVGTLLVRAALLGHVALRAGLLEDLLACGWFESL
jgi:hypothetical protein